MSNIYVLGSLNFDIVIRSPYIPVNGQTITGNGFMTNPGGKGANQAVACGKMNGKVLMAGCVGNDPFGHELIDQLKNNKVDTSCIRILDDEPTGSAVIVIVDNDNRIILAPNANSKVSNSDVDKLLCTAKKDDIFITQLEIPLEVSGYGLKLAKEKQMITILNPAPANSRVKEYLNYVDIITPNESELVGLIDKNDTIEVMCKELHKIYGIPNIIVTLGSKGQALYQNDIYQTFKCIKVNAVDTTAAGDTFCGALATKLAEGKTIEEAISFASVASSIAVTKKGAQRSIPTIEEVNAYLGK